MNRFLRCFVLFIVGIASFGCGRKDPDFTGIDPDVLQFHILADSRRHDALIAVAERQLQAEQDDGRPWSDEVRLATDSQSVAGRWMKISDEDYDLLQSSPHFILRERPIASGGPATRREVLVAISPNDVNRHDVGWVSEGHDEKGRPCVYIEMTAKGAKKFAQLTGENVPDSAGERRNLGIFVGGELMSAPTISMTISDRAQITGNFTERDVEDLVNALTVVQSTRSSISQP